MRRLPPFRGSALLLALTVLATSPAAFAQGEETEAGDTSEIAPDTSEPLRDRIRPVSGHMFLKKGRFELTPSAVLSLKDAFFNKYVLGGTIGYHITEEFAVAMRAGYSLTTISGAAQICPPDGSACRPPSYAEVNGRGTGQISLVTGLDLQWAPLYGKIALMAEQFLHFDMYAVAGPTAVQYLGPTDSGAPGSTARWTVGGSVGGGARFFFNRWLTFRGEVRDLIYVEEIFGQDNPGLQHQIMVELGISLFFPLDFKEG